MADGGPERSHTRTWLVADRAQQSIGVDPRMVDAEPCDEHVKRA
jgi:hypothetical protein